MSWLLFIVLTIITCSLTFYLVVRWSDASEPEPVDAPASRGMPSSRRSVPSAPIGVFASKATTDLDRPCPNHEGQAATWTCRFCKKDYCDKCARTTAGQKHCTSKKCVESAQSFAGARKTP